MNWNLNKKKEAGDREGQKSYRNVWGERKLMGTWWLFICNLLKYQAYQNIIVCNSKIIQTKKKEENTRREAKVQHLILSYRCASGTKKISKLRK